MKPSEIKALFPRDVEITQEIIDNADIMYKVNCIGALALKSFLPKKMHETISWGDSIGAIGGVKLKTEEWNEQAKMDVPVSLMGIKSPRSVTFKLRND